MKAVSPEIPYPYILKEDRGLSKEEQTIFNLTHLTVSEDAYLENRSGEMKRNGEYIVNVGDAIPLGLHLGLESVENFKNGSAEDVQLIRDETKKYLVGKKRPWSDESLSKIKRDARIELYTTIRNGGQLEEEEEKNS